MSDELDVAELEQQIAQLPIPEQLRLAAHICERLSNPPQRTMPASNAEILRQQPQQGVDALLALCENAAAKWEGKFDSASDIQQLRQGRDDQVWLSKS